uniref:Uncharacterized protein n=1 Tax=uncultured Thiotrichaceae bacterium TaxID=298394 RepID=A0A6S6SQP9_9GAMM|nr:MAG: Unknown protein [uncultured Thiotrichaceae bacterium]
MSNTLKHSINAQRVVLREVLGDALDKVTSDLPDLMTDVDALDMRLREIFEVLDHCKYLYVLDDKGVQVSANINRYGADKEMRGRDRSMRPYMQHMHDDSVTCHLSEAYISRNKKRPSVTAVKTLRDEQGKRLGFLGVDFDLRELPHSDVMYEEPSQWRQIKGDPAIRQGLFHQERVESLMDDQLDHVLSVHEALMLDQGVHHIELHFSSSRSTVWHTDDPYVYRLLTMDELSDGNICLAYPSRPYFERAIVPQAAIGKVLKQFKALRLADEVIYLRSASLNIVNGKIGLNFSCDGTHYLNYDEFLDKGLDFWFGGESFPQHVLPATTDVVRDYSELDLVIEEIAGKGCMQVSKLLYAMEKDEQPERVAEYSQADRDYIYRELKSVMDVYEGGVCSI